MIIHILKFMVQQKFIFKETKQNFMVVEYL